MTIKCITDIYWYDVMRFEHLHVILLPVGWLCVLRSCSFFSGLYVASDGSGSSVGIATDYGLDGPGSNPSGDEIFRPSRPALGPTQPPVKWVSSLSRV